MQINNYANIIFLFPTMAEIPPSLKPARMIPDKIYAVNDFSIMCTGPGLRIAEVIEKFAQQLVGNLVIVIGTAGGLYPDLQPGDLIVCDKFCQSACAPIRAAEIHTKIIDILASAGLAVSVGTSCTCSKIINDIDDKKQMTQNGYSIVEMENYWAANQARLWGMDIISVRMVLDNSNDTLPDLLDTLTADGQTSVALALRHLLKFPHHLLAMLKLLFTMRRYLPLLAQCCSLIAAHCKKML